MKRYTHFILTTAMVLLGVSCAPQLGEETPSGISEDARRAQDILVTFLRRLHEGNYREAAELYGGTYELMTDHNPELDPEDPSALLKNACTINGAQCLQVKSGELDRVVSESEFIFKVEFSNPDGTLFVRGPCCGGNETDFPPESIFYFTVVKIGEDKFTVMDMPPYVP